MHWMVFDLTRKVQYTLKKSSKRSTVAVKVLNNGEVEVLAPNWYSRKQADGVIEAKKGWIARKQQEFAQRPKIKERAYCDGEVFYFLGEAKTLNILYSRKQQVSLAEHQIQVDLGPRFTSQDEHTRRKTVRTILLKWYRLQAEQEVKRIIAAWCLKYPELGHGGSELVRVRMMKRRWGSCSREGHLTFSTRLLCAPEHLISYVVVHELCHRLVFNHQKQFYECLGGYLPDFSAKEQELRKTAGLWVL
ncbi:MAG: M48 family metallopeptidase [Spirochaetota bacterium]